MNKTLIIAHRGGALEYQEHSWNAFKSCLKESSINGIEEADLIFIAGANPRYEATILNARIRKAYLNNNTKIISLNDVGDLTYPYQSLDGQTLTLNNIFEETHEWIDDFNKKFDVDYFDSLIDKYIIGAINM